MNIKTMLLATAMLSLATTAQAQSIDPKVQARIDRILKATPLIDGHNDCPARLATITSLALPVLRAARIAFSPIP
jgi:hypothetical protein